MNFKRLLNMAVGLGAAYYSYRVLKKCGAEVKQEEEAREVANQKERERLANQGLTEDGLRAICDSQKSGMVKLAEVLKTSTTWDLEDTWLGNEDYIQDNMILVSQSQNPGSGKLEWTVKVKMPAFKPNTPIAPDYQEQLEAFLEDFFKAGGVNYRTRKKYFGIYNVSGNYTVDETTGEKKAPLYCFPIISDDLDAFKEDGGKGNGLEKIFSLFREDKLDEIEKKLYMRDEMLLQDIEMYLEMSFPVATKEGMSGLDLVGMQEFLKELLGTEITNSRSGGRYSQKLGPVAICANTNPKEEVTNFLIWDKGLVEKNLVVSGIDE
jgi:hypothetical protein